MTLRENFHRIFEKELVEEILKTAIKNGIKCAETGPMLEENKEILAQWEIFDDKYIIKRRRCWIKEFD